MCRTLQSILQSLICVVQMLIRIFITVLLMVENMIRMVLQTVYNFVSFMLQMISLLPICVVFIVTSRLKCFICSGGSCQVPSGGGCDCFMTAMSLIIVFFILRATGLLDKIFTRLGYAKAKPVAFTRFVPTPGDITECSRNDTDDSDALTTTPTDDVTFGVRLRNLPPVDLSDEDDTSKAATWTTVFYLA